MNMNTTSLNIPNQRPMVRTDQTIRERVQRALANVGTENGEEIIGRMLALQPVRPVNIPPRDQQPLWLRTLEPMFQACRQRQRVEITEIGTGL